MKAGFICPQSVVGSIEKMSDITSMNPSCAISCFP